MTRSTIILSTLMLGWINFPAQAGLISSQNQNIWPVMSEHFTIPTDAGKTPVQHQINVDLEHPKYIKRLTQNARPYLYYVYQETEKKHMPAELALLPMVESDYVPYGYSRAGAVGLWQLMPSTANDFGIKMNSFYDGRRSTTVSTKAALTFLNYLYDQFNHNWLLAIAAYNAGPGTVMEAIHYNKEHGRPTNFWALPLPAETKAYIPKLLALAAIIQHPHTYGIHLSPVPNAPVSTPVTIHKEMPISKIATLAHTSVTTMKKLNPALKKAVTPPHEAVTLMIPINKKSEFVQQLNQQKKIDHEIAAKKMQHYSVKHGDSLSSIAKKYHTTISTLKEINQIHDGLIRLHQTILVPNKTVTTKIATGTKTIKTAQHKTKTHHSLAQHHSTTITHHYALSHHYTVHRGDNLRVLAHRYHTTIHTLMVDNHLHSVMLQPGQHLVV